MKYFAVLFLSFFLCSCGSSTEKEIESTFASLKDGQAKVLISIDDKAFYLPESIFFGDVQVFDNSFRLNVYDQFESNLVVSFGGNQWYEKKPISKQVFANNQISASVMIGKLIDKKKLIGEGYLMTDGEIKIKSFSREKLVLELTGKVGRYQTEREPEKWNTLTGLIIYKKPKLVIQDLTESQLFY